METSNTKKKGFASLSPEKRREIASKGGKAVHQKGNAHKFNSETARKAGKIGGKSVSENKEHMEDIGRKCGEASSVAKGKKIIRIDTRRP